MEAEILNVMSNGTQVFVKVVYRDQGKEFSKEISFSSQNISATLLREKIINDGILLLQTDSNEMIAKSLVGEIIPVEIPVSIPEEAIPGEIV